MPKLIPFLIVLLAPSLSFGFYEKLLENAYQNSRDLKLAFHQKEQKQHNIYSSWAHALPKVDLSMNAQVQKDYSFLVSGSLPSSFSSLQPSEVSIMGWTAKATIPLFQKTLFTQILISTKDSEVADFAYAIERKRIDVALTQLLGEYLISKITLSNLSGSIDSAQKRETETKVRYDIGQRTEIDFLKAQANRTSLESRKLGVEQELEIKLKNLLDYCGLEVKTFNSILAENQDDKRMENYFKEALQKSSLPQTLEPYLSSTESSLKQLSKSWHVQKLESEETLNKNQSLTLSSQEWPSLVLSGQLSTLNQDFSRLFNAPIVSYQAGVVLTIPLFLGGSALSTQAEIAETEKLAEIKREKALLELRNNVEANRLKILSLRKLLDSIELQSESQARIYRLSQKSYELGRISMTELLESENADFESRIQLSRTRLDLLLAMKQLAFQLGVL